MPRGVRTVSLAGSEVNSPSNLFRSGTENTGGEWLVQPTCRGCRHSVESPSGAQQGGQRLVLPWNSPAARRRWEHLRAVVI